MDNSLPNSYLFSRFNDLILVKKKTLNIVTSFTKDSQNNRKIFKLHK